MSDQSKNKEKEEEVKAKVEDPTTTKKTIKHIVCSGGGATGFSFYGILRETHRRGLWDLKNIETVYGTSAGAIFVITVILGYNWDIMDDFVIKRPWHNVFKFDFNTMLNSFTNNGIFNKKVTEELFLPLFKGKDISINVTMKEFYELNKIDLHIYACEINSFELVDFSHKTHPDWRVVDVVYCSLAVPTIFYPFFKNDHCYCDGGLFDDYPIDQCIEHGADPDEILGIYRTNVDANDGEFVKPEDNMLEYITTIIKKLVRKHYRKPIVSVANDFMIRSPNVSAYTIYSSTSNVDERIKLIQEGVDVVIQKLDKKTLV